MHKTKGTPYFHLPSQKVRSFQPKKEEEEEEEGEKNKERRKPLSKNPSQNSAKIVKKRNEREMCPLRVILIFLSATLAGFFVLRNLKAQPEEDSQRVEEKEEIPICKKVGSAICTGFWTSVDMASGRYLWRNLVASNPEKKC